MPPDSPFCIVEEGANPSGDFFVRPELERREAGWRDLKLADSPMGLDPPDGANLLFVRYLNGPWRRWAEQHRNRLGGIFFFMDDDLLDSGAHRHLPWRYRWKLYRLALRHRAWLRKMDAKLWVSTPWLGEKYADWEPTLLAPRSPYGAVLPQKTLFYHGSASHGEEIRWLLPVIEAVLAREPTLSFEIIGDARVRARFAGLPRVHVLHPMKWPAYQALISRPGRTIGLAPLLDSPFNQARAPTKFYDITQAGAVGLYADHPVYRTRVEHQGNGLLLPMDREIWIEAILTLAREDATRERLLWGARDCL